MDKNKISISFDILAVVIIISFFIGTMAGYRIEEHHSKFCPECGSRYGMDAEYCEHDGLKLKEKK